MPHDYDLTIDELIERSSLGTPEAKALRSLARDEDIEEIFRRLGYQVPERRQRRG